MGATNPNAGGAPGGGGKGGMNQNLRGPAGNAQNNPGGPQANYGMGMNPMQGFANMNKLGQGLGSGGYGGGSQYTGMMDRAPSQTIQDLVRMERGFGNFGGNQTPINQAVQAPQAYQPSTGWVGGQPAQFAAQKAAMNNPAPSPQQGILDIRNRMLYGR